jgi:hypothetical protein
MAAVDPMLGKNHAWQGGLISRSTTPTLYHSEGSYYSMIARLCLAEKGVAYKSRLVDLHTQTEQARCRP